MVTMPLVDPEVTDMDMNIGVKDEEVEADVAQDGHICGTTTVVR